MQRQLLQRPLTPACENASTGVAEAGDMLKLGLLILAGSCAPLLVIGLVDPSANPVGPGMLAGFGAPIGVLVTLLGAARRIRSIT